MDFSQIYGGAGSGLFTMVAFILALSVIVAIHEYGHYIVGRWCGIHAEVFSLGFGPILYSRVDKRGTKWQVAALPFGGYVKFLGDANAASVGSTGDVSAADHRRTMHGAPLWARALTVAAGPVFNFILAIVIISGVIMMQGRATDPLVYEGGIDLPASYVNQLQTGDELIGAVGIPFGQGAEILDKMPLEPTVEYQIRRDGRDMTVKGPYLMPSAVTSFVPRSAADDAGLRPGDVITAIDGTPVVAFSQLVDTVTEVAGAPMTITVWRDGAELEFTLAPRSVDRPLPEGGFETRYMIGITGGVFFQEQTERLGAWESLKLGTSQVSFLLKSSLSGLYHVVTGAISTCNLSGPVGIAETSGAMASQGGTSFLWLIGVLSAGVGMLNLFPVPVLDGGHLVFHAYEAITRRKPSEGAYNILMMIGLALIATLMIFAIFNDLLFCP